MPPSHPPPRFHFGRVSRFFMRVLRKGHGASQVQPQHRVSRQIIIFSLDDFLVLISRHFQIRSSHARASVAAGSLCHIPRNITQNPLHIFLAARGRIRPKFITTVSRSAAVNLMRCVCHVTCGVCQQRSAALRATCGRLHPVSKSYKQNPLGPLCCSAPTLNRLVFSIFGALFINRLKLSIHTMKTRTFSSVNLPPTRSKKRRETKSSLWKSRSTRAAAASSAAAVTGQAKQPPFLKLRSSFAEFLKLHVASSVF